MDRTVSRRDYIASAGAAAGLGFIAGCTGGDDGDGGTDGGATTKPPTSSGDGGMYEAEVTVTHWPILMYAPPYQAAMENGYFEEEGIRLTDVVGSSGGGTTVRNVVTGGLPFGEVSTPGAVNAYYAGAPLSIVAGTTNSPGTINWVVPSGSEIGDIADLAGRTVGYTSAGSVTQNTSALSVRRADGVSVDEVEFQAMGGLSEGLTAIDEGSIDAAAHLDPVFSNHQQDDRWEVAFWAKDYIDTFQQTSVITGPDVKEENPGAVEGFLRARARGVEFVRENPDEAAEIFASHNDGYGADVMRAAIENVEPGRYYTTNGFSVPGLRLVETGMKNIDLISRNIEWSEIVDQSFLPEGKRVDVGEAEQ